MTGRRLRAHGVRGVSFVELLVSMSIMLLITGSMFGIMNAARSAFEVDLDRTDMQQRARVSADALFRDLVNAGAGSLVPAVAPLRRGVFNPDPPGSAFSDRLSVVYAPPNAAPGERVMVTYAVRNDAAGVPQLTKYDGESTELPIVDHVDTLQFQYFDGAGLPMALERFVDGPWVPDASAANRFDGDLHAIRRVRVIMHLRPVRAIVGMPVANLAVTIDVAPRNLNLE